MPVQVSAVAPAPEAGVWRDARSASSHAVSHAKRIILQLPIVAM